MSRHTNRGKGSYTVPSGRGACGSGKVQFSSRKQARQARRMLADSTLAIYRCTDCTWFHIGHLPARVRNGEVDKAAWQAAIR